MPADFDFEPLSEDELLRQLAKPATRNRISTGSKLVEDFLGRGEIASRLTFHTKSARDSAATSASSYIKRTAKHVAIRKTGPLELMIVDLDKASPETARLISRHRRKT